MAKIDAKTLLEAGVHFGHRTDKWNPKMAPYIYQARNGIHIINLNKTVEQIHAAEEFLRGVAEKGGRILFVGTKKAAQDTIKEVATRCQSYYVSERWLGGMLTNLNTIRKSVKRMQEIDEMEASGAFKGMPKQEVSALRRESAKIHRNLDGIKEMEKQPDAIVIVDVPREDIALTEATKLKIPVVAMTDTNAKPDGIHIPIPANDDAIRSVSTILDVLAAAVSEGNVVGNQKRADDKAKEAKEAKEKKAKSAAPKATPKAAAKAAPESAPKSAPEATAKSEAKPVAEKAGEANTSTASA